VIEFPPYRLDPRAGRLWRGGQPVALRPKAWELLRYLVDHSGALVTKDELHAAVWGDTVVSDDTVTRTLAELRLALRDDPRTPRIIETVHRRGFRFIARLHGSSGENQTAVSPEVPEPMPETGTATLVGSEVELARSRECERCRPARRHRRENEVVPAEADRPPAGPRKGKA
jgi:DNA-binding winged helix-turn-helix (wHTH) protein